MTEKIRTKLAFFCQATYHNLNPEHPDGGAGCYWVFPDGEERPCLEWNPEKSQDGMRVFEQLRIFHSLLLGGMLGEMSKMVYDKKPFLFMSLVCKAAKVLL